MLQIEYVNIDTLRLYDKNAKLHPQSQIDQIKASIEEFGMNDPIAIWNNEIVEGNGRYLACKDLGLEQIPIIRLDHLTDEQRRAYLLVHNQLTMNTDWDLDMVQDEINKILDIDMEKYGFDIEVPEIEVPEIKINERERTNEAYNLELFDADACDGKYQMPIIENDNYVPKDLMGFNYAKTSENKNVGIHFYLDDYQFERIWNNPQEYVEVLGDYDCILSPDFSLYMDMPIAMKIWNIYRSRLIGQYYQRCGIKVIPTISWAEKETFEFCFDGIPEGSIVSISTIGVKRNTDALKIWKDGMDAMIEKIKPSKILVYGGKIKEFDFGDIETIYYENKITEKLKDIKNE